jgi:hypothetical protein
MIKITIDFKDAKKFDNLIRYIESDRMLFEAQDEVRDLTYDTVVTMRETINTERKNPARPDGKLEKAIIAEELNTTAGIEMGIGRITTLVAEAPYFELINDGGTYTTKTRHLVPTTYFAHPESEFILFKEGSRHTIEGIDYIGKAIRKLDKELREMIEKMGTKFIGGAQKASI